MINLQQVWDQAEIELGTPGSAVRNASVVRYVTDCAKPPGVVQEERSFKDISYL